MIQIFRKNWFVFTLLLLPYTVVIRIWAFFDSPQWPYPISDQSPVYQYFEQFFPESYSMNVLVASVLIFFNAAQINNIVIKNRVARDINLFPGMVFIILSALHKDMFWVSPQLIAITFLLMGVANVFRIYQKPMASKYIFNAGFFTGISTLFYFPYLIFLVFMFISILILRRFKLIDLFQLFTGFGLVFFFLAFLLFWNNQDYNIFLLFKGQFRWSLGFKAYKLNEYLIFGSIVAMIIMSMTNYRKFTIKKSIQSQKKVNLVYWMMIFGLLSLPFIPTSLIFPALLAVFISFSIFIGMVMTRSRNETAMELIHLFVLFFIIFSHFWF